MGLNANSIPFQGTSKFPPAEPLEKGVYPARVVGVATMGTQPQPPYKGQEKTPVMMLRVTYELLDAFMQDEDGNDIEDKPRWLSEDFPFHNLQSELAKSTKRYYALDPDETFGGDWTQLVGMPCMVTISADKSKKPGDDRVFNNVISISTMRPKEAAKAPELVNPPFVFDFYAPDAAVWKKFPKWLQDKIKGAVDYKGSALNDLVDNMPDDNDKDEDDGKDEDFVAAVEKIEKPTGRANGTLARTRGRAKPDADEGGW